MKVTGLFGLLALAFALAGCSLTGEKKVDTSVDESSVIDGKANAVADGGSVKGMQKNAVIIFDASGSMNQMVDGKKKIDIAKVSTTKLIDKLDADTKVGIIVYGQAGSNSEADKKVSCETISEVYYYGDLNKEVAKAKINSITANGWTPIANALKKAQTILAGQPDAQNKVMLISDGQETCGGDPVALAKEANLDGIIVDVVGFDVMGAEEQQLKDISVQGKGSYYSVKGEGDFSVVVNELGVKVNTGDVSVDINNGNIDVDTKDAQFKMDDSGNMEVDAGNIEVDYQGDGKVDVDVPGVDIPKY